MKKKPRNARFWIWWNQDWVKLTLKEGQDLHLFESQVEDEGWSSFSVQYTHKGDFVEMQYMSDGIDCDGRLQRGGTSVCDLGQLASREMVGGTMAPQWIKAEEHQRDFQAERAGY